MSQLHGEETHWLIGALGAIAILAVFFSAGAFIFWLVLTMPTAF